VSWTARRQRVAGSDGYGARAAVVAMTLLRCARGGSPFLRFAAALGGLAIDELADQLLQHDRRLREGNRIAALQHFAVRTRLEPDVLLAEQPGGENRRRG